MAALRSSVAVALALAFAGIATGAPTPHGNFDGARAPTDGPLLDRAALFRPAQVGECAAVTQRRALPGEATRGRDARRAASRERKAIASLGCNVVWSD